MGSREDVHRGDARRRNDRVIRLRNKQHVEQRNCFHRRHRSQAHGSRGPARDSFGDPYVTDSQVRKIKVGMSARAAFRALGGKADSGYNGTQAVPPLSYDYPIRGTGNPDDVNDTKTIYWQVCVKNGRISGKVRSRMDSLPAMGC